ncbi:MAG: membrane protein required for colicin V production [Rhodothermales bacterium]
MGILDIVIVALLAVGVVTGFRTGFFKQAGGIAGILIGFALGLGLMKPVGDYLISKSGMEPAVGPVLGFVAVFAAAYLLVQIVAKVGETLLGAAKLTFVNKLLGGGVGGIKAAMMMSIAFIGAAYIQVPPQSTRDNSALYHSVAAIMPVAWSMVSENSESLDELSRRIEEKIPTVDSDSDSGSEASESN